MKTKKQILLPGTGKQLEFLRRYFSGEADSILIIGSSSEIQALSLSGSFHTKVNLITEDYESFINSKIVLNNQEHVELKMMSFDATDFSNNEFDLIYAQASVSSVNRNKIVKEIKRILKPGGFFCVGEIVSLTKEIPQFMKDIFDNSNLLPLFVDDLNNYYAERKFSILAAENLSATLKEYYSLNISKLENVKDNLTDGEKSYYKKLLNKISHESNVYLKLGGDKHLGFYTLLLQKGETSLARQD